MVVILISSSSIVTVVVSGSISDSDTLDGLDVVIIVPLVTSDNFLSSIVVEIPSTYSVVDCVEDITGEDGAKVVVASSFSDEDDEDSDEDGN